MISPERFLTLLEERGLLSSRTVAGLREQIAQSAEPITAAALAKRLVKHGKLTSSQAKRMLAEDAEKPSPAKAAAKTQPKVGDDLAFAPSDDEQADKPADKPRAKKDSSRRRPATAAPRSPVAPSTSAPESPCSMMTGRRARPRVKLPDRSKASSSDSSMSGTVAGGPLTSAASPRRSFWSLFSRRPKRPKKTEEEKWGGGLMLVGGGGLVVLVLLSGFLIYAMNYTGAEKMLDLANGEYRNGSYTQAIAKYNAFLEKFPIAWAGQPGAGADRLGQNAPSHQQLEFVVGPASGRRRTEDHDPGKGLQRGARRVGRHAVDDRRGIGRRRHEEAHRETGR